MSGFKKGAANSGLEDDEPEDEPEAPEVGTAENSGGGSSKEGPTDEVSTSQNDAGSSLESSSLDDTNQQAATGQGLPYIFSRSSVHEGRSARQIHLQDETERKEGSAKSELESHLGESVKKADMREAALLVGLKNLDETAAQLREWGYDYE